MLGGGGAVTVSGPGSLPYLSAGAGSLLFLPAGSDSLPAGADSLLFLPAGGGTDTVGEDTGDVCMDVVEVSASEVCVVFGVVMMMVVDDDVVHAGESLYYSPKKVCQIVLACCMFHNLALRRHVQFLKEEETGDARVAAVDPVDSKDEEAEDEDEDNRTYVI
ncbi:hypothetical protein NDU88_004680 [Pleurodeles waltl]|uniref:Nuclease HARBI1 n=1 Tax=Pleurodeles waltl TaxID=8319 RepID=A0AAV7NMZ2_PLEWA|nr:hypothetical protein NDU88_004680 [Pleurodeles waltl]